MAKKINARDDRAVIDAGIRATRPARKATIADTGDNARKRRPPSDPTLLAMSARNATDATYTDKGNPGTDLKDQAARDRHDMRRGWFMTEAHRQSLNRARMAKCEAFYDSEQWDYLDAQVLKDRGQDPIVYNEIKPTIDWLIGTERRLRSDFIVMPEDGENDDESEDADEDAQVKTKMMKWLDATNNAHFERSWAAEDAFKGGMGWIEVALRGDRTGPPIYVGCESWRNILWDSQAQRRDLQDARYLFRIKVVDYDVAQAIFPDCKEKLARCIQTGDTLQVFSEWMGGMGVLAGLDDFNAMSDPLDYMTSKPVDMFNARKRILLLECWSRDPVPRKPTTDGLGDPVEFRINVAIMTEHDTLVETASPYKHDRFPFIPVWAYRNKRTGLPYSPIWPLIGPQVGLNKRMSKSLLEANANQIELEVGAVDATVMNIDELRAEYDDPHGIAILANGALSGNKVRKVEHGSKTAEQIKLAERDSAMIRSMSGVNADNRGERSNVQSGKAVLAKQDQGSLLTAELFDHQLFARQLEGEMTLSLAEQGMLAPRVIRVPGGKPSDKVRLNQPQPDGTYLNDLSRRRAKFVVGEQAWKQAYAEAAFESLFDVLSKLATAAPQAVINLLDLVFDMHPNLPKKRQIVERMRAINGQADPDGKLTPEQQAELAQKQAVAKAQFEAQMAQLVADVQEAQARGENLRSDAVLKRLSAVYEAAQAATVIGSMPETAPLADSLLLSAGFEDQTADDGLIDPIPPQQTPTPTPGIDPVAPDQGAVPAIA